MITPTIPFAQCSRLPWIVATIRLGSRNTRTHGTAILYEEEIQLGWDETIEASFSDYALELDSLQEEFADRLCVLKGFEAEIVPLQHIPRS